MAARLHFASLISPGLMLDLVDNGEDALVVTAGSSAVEASCPMYGAALRRVQRH